MAASNDDPPKKPDGPSVDFAPNDLLRRYPRLFMTYHAMGTPWDVFNTAGVVIGGALALTPLRSRFPSALALVGTAGTILGCSGMALGIARLAYTVLADKEWDDTGIQQRVDKLSRNFKVRVLDLSVWSGLGLAALALVANKGPTSLGLSPSVLGVTQALSLGSALGAVGAFGCIFSTASKSRDKEEK